MPRRDRFTYRSPSRLVLTLLAGFAFMVAGCGEETQSPTSPAAEPELAVASAPLTFAQISAGNLHVCGVTTTGKGYCWGANGGNLGDGTGTDRHVPVAILGGLVFKEVRAGTTHSCGLTTAGKAYCWGRNDLGQLGTGNYPFGSSTPVAVAGGRIFTEIKVGFRHSCALTSGGVAFCWGENVHAQLGLGTTTGPEDCSGVSCSSRPVRVTGDLTFRSIRPGGEHTCGLTSTGKAYCWGENIYGQIGDGTIDVRLKPTAVSGGHVFRVLSAGGMHTCAVTTSDAAYCWGRNKDGRIGDGGISPRRRVPYAVTGGLKFSGVSAGTEHTCGVTTASVAYCWGSNVYAQLGDGTRTNRASPRKVAGGLFWKSVLAGWRVSCGIIGSGRAYCWGENDFGAVGDGTTIPRLTPVAVAGP